MKFNSNGQVVSEKSFENIDDGRQSLSSYKLPKSLWLRGGKNTLFIIFVEVQSLQLK